MKQSDFVVVPKGQRQPCLIYSRVVGYLQPIQTWNEGQREQFRQRKTFKIPEAIDEDTN